MGNKHTKTSDLTILQLMEILSEMSDDSRLSEEFWTENGEVAQEMGKRLAITPAPDDCAALASSYDLSGGQIENVARKYAINATLYGDKKRPVDILHEYCRTERLCHRAERRIGFYV